MALAENGVDLVLNGRDAAALDITAADIADRFGVSVSPVVGDVSEPEVQAGIKPLQLLGGMLVPK